MNKVEKLFINSVLKRGGLSLYSKRDVLEFVKECKNENIRLLGIDGFFLTDKTTQPSMKDSIDFSSSSFLGDVYENAVSFLEKTQDDLFFEIICE